MKVGFLALRLLKFISLISFIVILFAAYYYLPANVAIHYNDAGKPDGFIDKPTFFYACGIFVVILNVAVSLLAKIIFSVPAKLFPMPNRNYWVSDQENQQEFHEILRDWLNSLVVIINVFVFLCIYALIRLNTSEEIDVMDYSWIFMLGLIILPVWILFLPVRLVIKKSSLLG